MPLKLTVIAMAALTLSITCAFAGDAGQHGGSGRRLGSNGNYRGWHYRVFTHALPVAICIPCLNAPPRIR